MPHLRPFWCYNDCAGLNRRDSPVLQPEQPSEPGQNNNQHWTDGRGATDAKGWSSPSMSLAFDVADVSKGQQFNHPMRVCCCLVVMSRVGSPAVNTVGLAVCPTGPEEAMPCSTASDDPGSTESQGEAKRCRRQWEDQSVSSWRPTNVYSGRRSSKS